MDTLPHIHRPEKTFRELNNVGRSKYLIGFHDGIKQHNDGSPFFDIIIFSNKRKKDLFVRSLREQGYKPS